jgi:hypothetical protein
MPTGDFVAGREDSDEFHRDTVPGIDGNQTMR